MFECIYKVDLLHVAKFLNSVFSKLLIGSFSLNFLAELHFVDVLVSNFTHFYQPFSGNSNNFATQQDCEEYCGVGGCPEGGQPYRDARGQYQLCGNGIGCPLTHYCTQVTLGTTTAYNYCCPTKGKHWDCCESFCTESWWSRDEHSPSDFWKLSGVKSQIELINCSFQASNALQSWARIGFAYMHNLISS